MKAEQSRQMARPAEALKPEILPSAAENAYLRIREGRFQRWMPLIAGLSIG
jgi:hypothetical protein